MNERTAEPREVSKPRCGTCQRSIAPGQASVVFPQFHSRCMERAMAQARAEDALWDMD